MAGKQLISWGAEEVIALIAGSLGLDTDKVHKFLNGDDNQFDEAVRNRIKDTWNTYAPNFGLPGFDAVRSGSDEDKKEEKRPTKGNNPNADEKFEIPEVKRPAIDDRRNDHSQDNTENKYRFDDPIAIPDHLPPFGMRRRAGGGEDNREDDGIGFETPDQKNKRDKDRDSDAGDNPDDDFDDIELDPGDGHPVDPNPDDPDDGEGFPVNEIPRVPDGWSWGRYLGWLAGLGFSAGIIDEVRKRGEHSDDKKVTPPPDDTKKPPTTPPTTPPDNSTPPPVPPNQPPSKHDTYFPNPHEKISRTNNNENFVGNYQYSSAHSQHQHIVRDPIHDPIHTVFGYQIEPFNLQRKRKR